MHLAILHYHLNRGGVTQAILNHLDSLAVCDAGDRPECVAVVCSGRREGWPDGDLSERWPFECQLVETPLLDYDTSFGAHPEKLADAITGGLSQAGFDPASTVLHTHNHALGKNASLPGALARLAERGWRLLMQVHDFAEDFRPANYRHLLRSLGLHSPDDLAAQLYPQGSGVHYATLTGRDHQLLARAGTPAARLHVLPNPIGEFVDLPEAAEVRTPVRTQLGLAAETPLAVYPVRGIRRKNVGELLLHNALAGPDTCFAVTLAPQNPAELASFDRWQDLAERLRLGCRFDIGVSGGVRFGDALAAADAVITTSVAEGFGMVFLETWLAGRALVGRNLPEITRDFLASGLRFPGLRDQLLVPVSWLDARQLQAELLELHSWTCHEFGVSPPADDSAKIDDLLAGEWIDFAALPKLHQVEVISHVAKAPSESRQAIAAGNQGFDAAAAVAAAGNGDLIAENAARVREAYSPKAVGERLASVYRAVLQDDPAKQVEPVANGRSILDWFLRLDRLFPVRVEA